MNTHEDYYPVYLQPEELLDNVPTEYANQWVIEQTQNSRWKVIWRPTKESESVDAIERVLIDRGAPIYRNEGMLVTIDDVETHAKRPERQEDGSISLVPATYRSVGIKPLTQTMLVDIMSRLIDFRSFNKDKKESAIPVPKEAASIILSRSGSWRYPRLSGILACPTIRPDGSLLSESGYDADTGYYLSSDVKLPHLGNGWQPDQKDANKALRHVRLLLREMPLVEHGDDASAGGGVKRDADGLPVEITTSEAAAISMFLSVICRGAFDVCPMHTTSGTDYGSSKTFIQQCAGILATEQEPPVMTWTPNDEENTKMLSAALQAGYPIIILDNVNGVLKNVLLAQAITQPRIDVRMLGKSELVRISHASTILANGVNIAPSEDLGRRVIAMRLNPGIENPHRREFKFNPKEVLKADRARYVEMCLAIVRAYVLSNRPGRLKPLGGFEGWSDLVRSAMVWLGCPDPVATQQAVLVGDPAREAERAFIAAWADAFRNGQQKLVSELIGYATGGYEAGLTEDERARRHAMKDHLQNLQGPGDLNLYRIGRRLSAKLGKVVDGHVFRFKEDQKTKSKRYWLEKA